MPTPLGSEGLLQGRLVMGVLKLSVLAFGGPADSHRPNGHPSLRRLGSLLPGCPRTSSHRPRGHYCLTLAGEVVLQGHCGLLEDGLLSHNLNLSHLDRPHLHLRGPALHIAVIAAAGAALHLHTGRPHQEVGVGAIDEVPRDLEHLCARLALGDYSRLCCCQGP